MRDRPERNHAAHRAGAGGGARVAGAGRLTSLVSRRADRSFIGAESGVCAQQYSGTRHVRQPNSYALAHGPRTTGSVADYRSRSAASPRGPPITPAVAAPTTDRTPATVYDTGNRTAVGSYDAMRVPGYLLRLARARARRALAEEIPAYHTL